MKKQIALSLLSALLLTFCFAHLPLASEAPPQDRSTNVEKFVRGTHGTAKAGNSRVPFNMVKVPRGDVVLGMNKELVEKMGEDQPTTLGFLSGSIPRHNQRSVGEFYCDKFEITNAQWKAFLDATRRSPNQLLRELAWKKGPDEGMSFPEGEDRFPIRNVDFTEAKAFARWCGKRIPTEQEWMRAASDNKGTLYAWGDDYDPKKCSTKDRRTRREKLMPVGSHTAGASPFGIQDMTGSVWEWTSTPFEAYKNFKPITYKLGRKKETLSPGFDSRQYVVKGGVYNGNDLVNLLPVRQPCLSNTNLDSLGFRCVKNPKVGRDIFETALKELNSAYLKENRWDDRNFYAIEASHVDTDREIIVGFDYLVFAPMAGLLTSISKINKNNNPTPDGYLPLGVLSVSRPLESPLLPPGPYTLVYRNKGAGAEEETAAVEPVKPKEEKKPEEPKKDEPKKEGEEGEPQEKTEEEKQKEEEEKRIAEENAKAKAAADAENARALADLEKIGAVSASKNDIPFPKDKNLILFLNPSDTVVGFVEVEKFIEGGEEPIRMIHIQSSGNTEMEFSVRILGSKHPRFKLPIRILENPF